MGNPICQWKGGRCPLPSIITVQLNQPQRYAIELCHNHLHEYLRENQMSFDQLIGGEDVGE